jgi:putative DNA primase/helicase
MTYLRPDGSGKIDAPRKELQRETRGPIAGGAVRLASYESDRELIVTEGIETAASCMQMFGLPAWAALSTSELKALELPPEVRNVLIAVDNDEHGAGQDASLTAMRRWQEEGRSVRRRIPNKSGDFNDVLREQSSSRCHPVVKNIVDNGNLTKAAESLASTANIVPLSPLSPLSRVV